jgi:RNA polymerase-binding transcription factor DksA
MSFEEEKLIFKGAVDRAKQCLKEASSLRIDRDTKKTIEKILKALRRIQYFSHFSEEDDVPN